jgi:hypothetical protein
MRFMRSKTVTRVTCGVGLFLRCIPAAASTTAWLPQPEAVGAFIKALLGG